MSDERPLQGQVALITGASRGIGKATALACAKAGADIAIGCTAKSAAADAVAEEVRSHGVKAVVLDADLADASAAMGLVSRTVEQLGHLDILVNNAGITRDNLCLRLSDTDWSDVLEVNLTAAFYLCRAALKPMVRQRSGRIINVSSYSGVRGNPGQVNYSAAKAGLIGLTKALCREVGSRDVTVNAVAPGFIETDMTAVLPKATREAAVTAVPLGRMGTAEEVAAAIRFLALPEAAYITGHVLQVDGGMGA